ncbi:embryonic polyadenylate-binding protein 2 [Thamnophis elegans]|uniref:embryonic polyadenylate-binding protein 2 n=1 Tax=Thamnophis elegans TaxID=35005 RepID=UPI00137723F6|nr:embryonic polyadenylate-binding protein 2 [Thamnophis elegans]
MFGLGASRHPFLASGSWWCNPPASDIDHSPWDAAEISAWQKNMEEDSASTPVEGANEEVQQAEDPELEAIKAKVRAMEKDDEWLQELQNEAKSLLGSSEPDLLLPRINEKKRDADQRSIYVGNVDYGGTAEELESYFNSCGQINRVTILCDKFSGHPKGYAYIEFAEQSALKAALELDEGTFRGRIIKVLPKRTNFPGISSTDRGGSRGRFRGRGAPPRHASFSGGQRSRSGGRVVRGRGRIPAWYVPY